MQDVFIRSGGTLGVICLQQAFIRLAPELAPRAPKGET